MYVSWSKSGRPNRRRRPAMNLTVRSALPVGAGLGSSASYSSCIATILLLSHRRITLPAKPLPTVQSSSSDPGHTHVSHEGRKALPKSFADEVNRWALVAEKVLHGNPSGVDNAVAVYGGALAFTKPGFAFAAGGMEGIQGWVSRGANSHPPADPPFISQFRG